MEYYVERYDHIGMAELQVLLDERSAGGWALVSHQIDRGQHWLIFERVPVA